MKSYFPIEAAASPHSFHQLMSGPPYYYSGVLEIHAPRVLAQPRKRHSVFALLIVAVVAITCGCFIKAAAETGLLATGNLKVSPEDDAFFANEARRRLEELPNQDFKKVFGPDDVSIELDVPVDGESIISLWFATAQGSFLMKLLGPDQQDSGRQLLVSWPDGWRGEQTFVRNLGTGKYLVKLQAIDGARVHGVIGIRRLDEGLNGLKVRYEYDPANGYLWPYLLVTPASPTAGALPGEDTLLVVPKLSDAGPCRTSPQPPGPAFESPRGRQPAGSRLPEQAQRYEDFADASSGLAVSNCTLGLGRRGGKGSLGPLTATGNSALLCW